MKVGLQIPDFTWPGGAKEIGPTLVKIARTADEAGFELIGVMDHFFQIGSLGPPEHEMLEGYTTLGFLAANTSRVRLVTIVAGAVYRYPGVLAKTVTTLDVLSGGRAMLGIGAAWNDYEAKALGIPFPPVAERFDWLEDTLRLCLQMWKGDETRLAGKRFTAERPLSSPQSLTRPHPPIMIGGMGEQKTLRLVAKYADACNLFPSPELPRKLDVLKRHCDREKRNYDEIEKTCMFRFDLGDRGQNVGTTIESLKRFRKMGITTVMGGVKDVSKIEPLERMAREVIPAVRDL
ncbi:MAG: LLM class F420-dependent oxidoreductase [Chloroflexi bacterium]|nr:MAG: LLM class F420-dependent oxidoreductase [Chloroflexota bacterium]